MYTIYSTIRKLIVLTKRIYMFIYTLTWIFAAFTMDSQGSDQQPFANDNHVQLNYNTLDDSSTDPTPTNNNQSSANNGKL